MIFFVILDNGGLQCTVPGMKIIEQLRLKYGDDPSIAEAIGGMSKQQVNDYRHKFPENVRSALRFLLRARRVLEQSEEEFIKTLEKDLNIK